jgi:hypothetical protein
MPSRKHARDMRQEGHEGDQFQKVDVDHAGRGWMLDDVRDEG